VAGLKGGVAKSTVSVSLASARGNTLLIDADDGSASAMRWAELATVEAVELRRRK
jgi:cellulose biosynthesis protein BcsQ